MISNSALISSIFFFQHPTQIKKYNFTLILKTSYQNALILIKLVQLPRKKIVSSSLSSNETPSTLTFFPVHCKQMIVLMKPINMNTFRTVRADYPSIKVPYIVTHILHERHWWWLFFE